MNQSEIEANICNRRHMREKACEQGTFGFGFAADWLRRWHMFAAQLQSEVKQHQSKREITLDTQLKTALKGQ